LGIHLTLFGLILQTNILWLWIFYPLYLLNFHFKIIEEEKSLILKYGRIYKAYINRTPRYF
jgi:protein-S-isoprenylcysteine O-methyltransferase Ste14